MKRKNMISLILLLLLVVFGALLPQAVICWRKSHLQTVTWTQARQDNSLDFDEYPRQYGDISISSNFSAHNVIDALQDLIISYMRAGLLPDMNIVHMTMPEYYVYQDELARKTLSATLQSEDDTVRVRLSAQERFPIFLSFQSLDQPIDARRFTLLLSQYYRIKGGCMQAENGVCHFTSQDGTLEFTVTPLTTQNNHGVEMQAFWAAAEARK